MHDFFARLASSSASWMTVGGGMGYLAAVASALLGAIVLGERPSVAAIAGMALVVVGGLVVTFIRKPEEE